MRKVLLTPFLVASLLLLPSCSSGSKTEKSTQEIADCKQIRVDYKKYEELYTKMDKGSAEYKLVYLTSQYYLLENMECFTPKEIAFARAAIDFVNNQR